MGLFDEYPPDWNLDGKHDTWDLIREIEILDDEERKKRESDLLISTGIDARLEGIDVLKDYDPVLGLRSDLLEQFQEDEEESDSQNESFVNYGRKIERSNDARDKLTDNDRLKSAQKSQDKISEVKENKENKTEKSATAWKARYDYNEDLDIAEIFIRVVLLATMIGCLSCIPILWKYEGVGITVLCIIAGLASLFLLCKLSSMRWRRKSRRRCVIIHTALLLIAVLPALIPYLTVRNAIDKGAELLREKQYKAAYETVDAVYRSSGVNFQEAEFYSMYYYSEGLMYAEKGEYYSARSCLKHVYRGSLPQDMREGYDRNAETVKQKCQLMDKESEEREREEKERKREEYYEKLKAGVPFYGVSVKDIDKSSLGPAKRKLRAIHQITDNTGKTEYRISDSYYFVGDTFDLIAYVYDGKVWKTEKKEYITDTRPGKELSGEELETYLEKCRELTVKQLEEKNEQVKRYEEKTAPGSGQKDYARQQKEEQEKWASIVGDYTDFDTFYDDYYDDFVDYDEAYDTYYDNGGF